MSGKKRAGSRSNHQRPDGRTVKRAIRRRSAAPRHDNPWQQARVPRLRSSEVLRQIDLQEDRSMDHKALGKALKIKSKSDVGELKHCIRQLLRQGQLVQHHGKLKTTDHYYTGILNVHPDGFGFVNCAERREDIYLPADEIHGLIHGDRVEVALQRRRGRESGRFVRLLEAAPAHMVARIERHGNVLLAIPRSRRFPHAVRIDEQHAMQAQDGDWVRLNFNRYSEPLKGKVEKILGKGMNAHELIDLVVHEHGLPDGFPDAALRQASQCPVTVNTALYQQRRDFTHLPFVTIDGEDARDFDDAICVVPRGAGFELWVAIADVAHYVRPGTALDEEARQRGNSFYLPDRVIPMLPEALSNGLCSLKPHQARLAMVARMRMDVTGRCRAVRLYEGIIRSRQRLIYTQVARWLEEGDAQAVADATLQQMLLDAAALAQLLLQRRENRGALDLDIPEAAISLEDGMVGSMHPGQRNQAHRLIEEMMLATNVAVAEELEKHERRFLYRIHPTPEAAAIHRLNAFLAPQGLQLSLPRKHGRSRPEEWQRLLRKADDQAWGHVLHRLMLRSMQQASYTPKNQGHFGLAYRSYAHFTSPIRRYADLCLHRQVKAMLHRQPDSTTEEELSAIGNHISAQERIAQRTEWDVRDMLAALYHSQHIGKTMTAVVSGISKRRVFFELLDSLAEASTALEQLPGQYELDEHRHCLRSRRGHTLLSLGDTVHVCIDACDPVLGQITVTLKR